MLLASGHPKLFSPGLDLVSLERARPAGHAPLHGPLRGDAVGALHAAAAGGGGGQRRGRGRRLRAGADRRLPRAEARRSHRAQRGQGRRARCPGRWRCCCARACRRPRSRRSRCSAATSRTTRRSRSGSRTRSRPRRASRRPAWRGCRSSSEKDAHSLAVTKSYLRAPVVDEMRAREAYEMDSWLDGWFSDATRARMKETVAALSKKG